MKIVTLLAIAVATLGSVIGSAQRPEALVQFDSVEVFAGDLFDFEISVSGFQQITSAQFGMQWDSSVVSLQSIQFIEDQSGVSLFTYRIATGDLRVLFEGTMGNGEGISYEDDTVIAVAKFVAIGDPGQSTRLIPNPAIPLEVVEGASLERQARIIDGWVHLRAASGVKSIAEHEVRVYWPDPRSMNIQTNLPGGTRLCVFAVDGRQIGCFLLEGNGDGNLAFESEQTPGIYYLKRFGAVHSLSMPIPGPGWR